MTMNTEQEILDEFEKKFPHLNDSTSEGGYDAKIYVKSFLSFTLTRQREAIIAEVEGKKMGGKDYEKINSFFVNGYNLALSDIIEVIKNIHD